jgi:hypothetical protein
MRRYGLVLVALLVGCFAGVAVREVVFPARAATGPTYDYKLVDLQDLIATVKSQNPKFANADRREAAEEGLRGFGRAGWRYVGCQHSSSFGWGTTGCTVWIFEQASGGAAPPPVVPQTPQPPEESHSGGSSHPGGGHP